MTAITNWTGLALEIERLPPESWSNHNTRANGKVVDQ